MIIKRFGSTGIRVKRLRAYILEAKGKFGDAEQIYKEILSVEPSNTVKNKIKFLFFQLSFLVACDEASDSDEKGSGEVSESDSVIE